ncbi:redox-sensing transcriptional repressor [Raineyella antarctica]|uniref:Redox-sensing transcriptional repressor Rex n=1 Tax=Raineyella antarctica TaxID=1577474 RepID=A0A1G6GER2_9ACTN|nr:redox-sensing transcriptional repressor Rex [Raineyella antarctica]SDB80235.1 redox-sensing transcriptional repressor [Raineyella antarctica]
MSEGAAQPVGSGGIPEATISRLPRYWQVLRDVRGQTTISSQQLAEAAGVNPAQLRKDLSYLGSVGTRGVGYDVGRLIDMVSGHLIGPASRPFMIIGMGQLGSAMAAFTGYAERGFRIAALIDIAPGLVGRRMRVAAAIGPTTMVVRSIDEIEQVVAETGATLALLCVPVRVAQQTVDRLAAAGVDSILNFAADGVHAPEGVRLRDVDLGRELQILAYYQQHPGAPAARPEPAAAEPDAVPTSAASDPSNDKKVSV